LKFLTGELFIFNLEFLVALLVNLYSCSCLFATQAEDKYKYKYRIKKVQYD